MKFLFTMLLSLTSVFSYDLMQTKDMLYLAQASYCDVDTKWECAVCNDNVILEEVIENNGAKALVGFHEKYNALFVA